MIFVLILALNMNVKVDIVAMETIGTYVKR